MTDEIGSGLQVIFSGHFYYFRYKMYYSYPYLIFWGPYLLELLFSP